MAVAFLLLAISFIADLWGQKREIIKHPPVDEKYFTKEPVRKTKLQPLLGEDGFACNDCHQDIEPSHVQKSFISAHEDITLQHGMNNYCTTCHSVNNKEALVDINGNDVPFEKNYLMCWVDVLNEFHLQTYLFEHLTERFLLILLERFNKVYLEIKGLMDIN